MKKIIPIKSIFGNYNVNVSKGADGELWEFWNWSTATSSFTIDQLKELFGLDQSVTDEDLSLNYTWRVNLVARSDGEISQDSMSATTYYLKELYAGDDLDAIDASVTDNTEIETGADFVDNTVGTVANTWDFVTDFIADQAKTVAKLILNGLIGIFDALQMLANSLQTAPLGTVLDFKITYSYQELVRDKNNGIIAQRAEEQGQPYEQSNGKRDMYTNVSEFEEQDSVSFEGQKYIYIDGEEKGFSEDTEIPVIPVDFYNLAIGNIGLTDINFFSTNGKHAEDSSWMILKNIAVTIMHITLYAGAAILMITLIWHGVCIVRGSLDNPKNRLEHKEGLKKFFISLLMLVGSIVIMALCIFASDLFLGKFRSETNEYELPVRVNVSFSSDSGMDGYSFSTNITGYIRYMAQIANIDNVGEKAAYTLGYMALVIVNLAGGTLMVLRMVGMLFLAILGPITAVMYATNTESKGILNYREWVSLYACGAAIQVFLAIVAFIILESTVFN